MAYPEHLDAATRESLDRFVVIARDRLPVVELRLYGSRARGDAHAESDVDVAVVYSGEERQRLGIIHELGDAMFDTMIDTGRLVSALPVHIREWVRPETFPNPILMDAIRIEGVRL